MTNRPITQDEQGAASLEFAFAVPIIFTMMIGITQMGTLFYANAGVKHAVAEGARLASIFPYPGETAVSAAVNGTNFGLDPANIVGTPAVVQRTDAGGNEVVDITLNYRVPLDFKFFTARPLTLSHTRTVFLQTGTEVTSPGGGTPTPTPTPSPTSTPTPTPTPTATPTPTPTPTPCNNGNGHGNGHGNC
jgi:Flp pilus assembly protein TadG